MNTTSAVVLTAIITTAGHWSQNKRVQMRVFVGMGVLAIILAALSEADAELAQKFGLLVVVAAALYYTVPIARGLGYTK